MPQEWTVLKREDIRLHTFDSNFSAPFLSPLALAKAGFFYVGVDDQVQCAFCRGVVRDWEINDDPKEEHQRLFPSCAFILGLPVGNIPLGEDPPVHHLLDHTTSLPISLPTTSGSEVARQFSSQLRPNASPDTEVGAPSTTQLNALVTENLEELGITKHSGPRYSTYSTMEARLRSYNQWPAHLKQTPYTMAQAGFFHLGVNDHVTCFHCGSGLRNWESEDDPWLEHARWFPQCRFVMLMKGEQYIKEASESRPISKANKPSTSGSHSRLFPREVSETELRALLVSPIAQSVLAMGVDISRVKQAFKYQIRNTGQPFESVDSLLEVAIAVQHCSEHRQALEDRNYEVVDWSSAMQLSRRDESSRASWIDEGVNVLRTQESYEGERMGGDRDQVRANGYVSSPEMRRNENSFPVEQTNRDIDRHVYEELEVESTASQAFGKIPKPSSTLTKNRVMQPEVNCEAHSTEVDRTRVLEEEIRRLKEARLCKVCLDEEVSIAYIPCGHIVTCVQCAAALEHCPLCRKSIKGTVRVFLS